ncbi:hypothetical protein NQZ68_035965 [Dissostichus eleginoides]|nr:hypothetical protein NQZ68_035965 [Dissostichus eleginoides]
MGASQKGESESASGSPGVEAAYFPWVQEKFSRIELGKLGRQGWGRKKSEGRAAPSPCSPIDVRDREKERERGRSMVTSLKGLNVGGATHERRLRVGGESRVEVEPKPSAAVPCHIFAEHDSRTARSGNDLGVSLQNTNKVLLLRVFLGPWISESGV